MHNVDLEDFFPPSAAPQLLALILKVKMDVQYYHLTERVKKSILSAGASFPCLPVLEWWGRNNRQRKIIYQLML